ncbi:hypothetical protein [Arthrobacter sp. UYCu723]
MSSFISGDHRKTSIAGDSAITNADLDAAVAAAIGVILPSDGGWSAA